MSSEVQRSVSRRQKRMLNKSAQNGGTTFSEEDEELTVRFAHISSRVATRQNCTITHELRIFVGTWNVAGRSPKRSLAIDLEEWLNPKSAVDIYVLGFQEIVPLNTRSVIGGEDNTGATQWNLLIGKTLNNEEGCIWLTPSSSSAPSDDNQCLKAQSAVKKNSRSKTPMRDRPRKSHGDSSRNNSYKLMASKKMVGVFMTIWMRQALTKKYSISDVKFCSVACGIMGCLGNKGSVAVSMSIEGTSFCFVTAHLASGEKKGDEVRRNQQVTDILKRMTFPRLPQENSHSLPLTIEGHQIFWFGDLNYRLNLEDSLARELIMRRNFRELQKSDQLNKELEEGGVFEGWREGNIEFAPTYKYYLSTSNRYTRNVPTRSGDKHRTPAWCDRILWRGKGIQQLSYGCGTSKFSDHRPVSALFCTEIEVINSNANPRAVALSKFLRL